jgi:4-hydroxy-4-methyl-2-oxoglutarate aldolase
MNKNRLAMGRLLKMKRWNTPTIYNGWEQVTAREDHVTGLFNLEETRDFMPQMGPMIGYAVTVVIQPGNKKEALSRPNAWQEYRKYLAGVPGPKIVVIQDLDKPSVIGSFWGEVSSNAHRALGCIGTITDGAIRDVDEMTSAGFKAIARRLCVSHAYSTPLRWGCEVEVFGCKVEPGRLIHADKHGFLVIPAEDESKVLESALFADSNECMTKIAASCLSVGKSLDEVQSDMSDADVEYSKASAEWVAENGKTK